VPDPAGQEAARRILDLASALGPEDQLVCLISGGGSALLTLPAPGLTLGDKAGGDAGALTGPARRSARINTVRKHLSAIKGRPPRRRRGAGADPHPGDSDVPGDDPAVHCLRPDIPRPDEPFADCARRPRQVPHR